MQEQPRQIIIRSPNWLGDQIMALSFYQGVRELFPESRIVCFRPYSLRGVLPSGLIDEDWEFKKEEIQKGSSRKEWIRKLKEGKFDISVSLTASWSSALLFYQAGIGSRLGFSQSGSGILLSSSLPWRGVKANKHKSLLYRELLHLLDAKASLLDLPKTLSVKKSPEDFLVLAPGAALPLREWPYFPELIFELKRRYPEREIKVVGTHTESAWQSRLKRWNLPGVSDYIGKTSVSELINLCSKASLVIANDSGVAHLSATLSQVPTIVIFGPGNPSYIAPQGPVVMPVKPAQLACSPCEKPYCRAPYGYQQCLREIKIHDVLSAVEKALSL